MYKHLANSLVSAPLTPVAPIFLPVGAFLHVPPAGRDVVPGRDVAAKKGTSKTNSIYSTSQ